MEFNLEELKKDIEARKSENLVREQAFGRGNGILKGDKKRFLVDLVNSVNQGADTPAVQTVRAISETTEKLHGMPRKGMTYNAPTQQTNAYIPPVPNQNLGVVNEGGFERGDSYFEQQQQRAQELLKLRLGNGAIQNPNAGLSQQLNEYAQTPYIGNNQPQYMNEQLGGNINANVLNEHIRKTMTEVLAGSTFDKIVEDTFRNVITEMYTKEKIENVVNEFINEGKFAKVVRDVIVDLQNRKKNTK